jgi:uncharacterized protein YacL
MANSTTTSPEIEKYRLAIAFLLSVFGLFLAALVVLILVLAKFQSSEITAIAGLFTTLLGTLVGAFFGLQIGAAGKEDTQKTLNTTQQQLSTTQQQLQRESEKAQLALGQLSPQDATALATKYSQLFSQ